DTVQNMGIPTVLIEAGHYPNDYQREETRKYVFIALLSALNHFSDDNLDKKFLEYFNIPNNSIFFFDFFYKNVKFNYDNKQIITNYAVQFSERVEDNQILLEAYLEEIGDLHGFAGHFEYNAKNGEYSDDFLNYPQINQKANFKI